MIPAHIGGICLNGPLYGVPWDNEAIAVSLQIHSTVLFLGSITPHFAGPSPSLHTSAQAPNHYAYLSGEKNKSPVASRMKMAAFYHCPAGLLRCNAKLLSREQKKKQRKDTFCGMGKRSFKEGPVSNPRHLPRRTHLKKEHASHQPINRRGAQGVDASKQTPPVACLVRAAHLDRYRLDPAQERLARAGAEVPFGGPDWYLPVDTQALQPRSSASQNETCSNSNSAKQRATQRKKKKKKTNPVANKSTSNQHPCPAVPTQHSCQPVLAALLDVPVTRIAYSR